MHLSLYLSRGSFHFLGMDLQTEGFIFQFCCFILALTVITIDASWLIFVLLDFFLPRMGIYFLLVFSSLM